jgi:hypothetical protein
MVNKGRGVVGVPAFALVVVRGSQIRGLSTTLRFGRDDRCCVMQIESERVMRWDICCPRSMRRLD